MAMIFLFLLMILKVSLKISKAPMNCMSLCLRSIGLWIDLLDWCSSEEEEEEDLGEGFEKKTR